MKRNPWTGVLPATLISLAMAPWARAAGAQEGAFDLEAFRRTMAQRHELEAKKNPRLVRERKLLERMVRKAPDLPGPRETLARLEEGWGNFEVAEADHQAALKRAGSWPGAVVGYARFLSNRSRVSDGASLLQSALALRPLDHCLARAYAAMVAETDNEEGSRLWAALAEGDILADDALMTSARADYSRQDYASCHRKTGLLAQRHPYCREVWEWRARAAQALGDPSAASLAVSEIAAKGGDCDDLLSWVEGLIGDRPERALPLFSQAVQRYPSCEGLFRRFGETLEEAGEPSEAVEAYRKARLLHGAHEPYLDSRLMELAGTVPPSPPAVAAPKVPPYWRGSAEKTLRDLKGRSFPRERDLPMELLKRIARDRKTVPDLMVWVATWAPRFPVASALVEAEAYRSQGEWDSARASLQKALEKRPLDARPYPPLCEALGQLGNPLEGSRAATRWVQTELSAEALAWRGRFLLREGKTVEAEPFLRSALEQDPHLGMAWSDLISLLERSLRSEEAKATAWEAAQWLPFRSELWQGVQRLGLPPGVVITKGLLFNLDNMTRIYDSKDLSLIR